MTDSNDKIPPSDDFLDLSPLPEEERELAPEEPFRPGMVLVPVVCGVCKLRMYAQEKYVGKWIACPDCGTLSRIMAVDPLLRYQVEPSAGKGYSLVPIDKKEAPSPPKIQANVDYRHVPGSIDEGAESIPFFGFSDKSEDDLENGIDRFLGKRKRKEEIRYERLTARDAEEKKRKAALSPEERERRLLQETITRKKLAAKDFGKRPIPRGTGSSSTTPIGAPPPIPSSVPPSKPPTTGVPSDRRRENVPPASRSEPASDQSVPAGFEGIVRDASVTLPRSLRKGSGARRKNVEGSPWRHFLTPFFDPENSRRFLFVWGTGVIACGMFSILLFFLKLFFDPSRSAGLSFHSFFALFYIQYLIACFPMALWGIILLINGMTLYSETKEGNNRIRHWIPFRAEFAGTYLFWLLNIFWLGSFPGAFLGAIFDFNKISFRIWGWNCLSPFSLGLVTLFLFFPLLFLSIDANNRGIDLYHPKVWKSLFRRSGAWFAYYFFSAILLVMTGTLFYGAFRFYWFSAETRLWWIPLCFAGGLIFCPLLSLILHLAFRLLGSLAWSIDLDADST